MDKRTAIEEYTKKKILRKDALSPFAKDQPQMSTELIAHLFGEDSVQYWWKQCSNEETTRKFKLQVWNEDTKHISMFHGKNWEKCSDIGNVNQQKSQISPQQTEYSRHQRIITRHARR